LVTRTGLSYAHTQITLVAILTDGYENGSKRHTMEDVNRRISHQREKYGWDFLFLGANQDAIATAARMGIASRDSATYVADGAGTLASHSSLSRKAKAMRLHAMQMADEEAEKRVQGPGLPPAEKIRRRGQACRQPPDRGNWRGMEWHRSGGETRPSAR
jgi:hypothetical protein